MKDKLITKLTSGNSRDFFALTEPNTELTRQASTKVAEDLILRSKTWIYH